MTNRDRKILGSTLALIVELLFIIIVGVDKAIAPIQTAREIYDGHLHRWLMGWGETK